MRGESLMVVAISACIILSIMQYSFAFPSEQHSRNFEIKCMKNCHLTINGRGYSSWLNGMSIKGKTFVSVACIYVKDGITTISSTKNPDEKYTFTGKELVFIMGYAGYYYSSHEYTPYIVYNGSAMMTIVISMQ